MEKSYRGLASLLMVTYKDCRIKYCGHSNVTTTVGACHLAKACDLCTEKIYWNLWNVVKCIDCGALMHGTCFKDFELTNVTGCIDEGELVKAEIVEECDGFLNDCGAVMHGTCSKDFEQTNVTECVGEAQLVKVEIEECIELALEDVSDNTKQEEITSGIMSNAVEDLIRNKLDCEPTKDVIGCEEEGELVKDEVVEKCEVMADEKKISEEAVCIESVLDDVRDNTEHSSIMDTAVEDLGASGAIPKEVQGAKGSGDQTEPNYWAERLAQVEKDKEKLTEWLSAVDGDLKRSVLQSRNLDPVQRQAYTRWLGGMVATARKISKPRFWLPTNGDAEGTPYDGKFL